MAQLARKFTFMKFILPHAPQQAVTLNGGMRMPSWYDIASLQEPTADEPEDLVGLQASRQTLLELISRERKEGISAGRIFVGGFSQGGVVALFTALSSKDDEASTTSGLAGIIALSSYVPVRAQLQEELAGTKTTRTPPIFMAHGTADQIISYRWHQDSVRFLRTSLPSSSHLQVRSYTGMQHEACQQELADMADFIAEQLGLGEARAQKPLHEEL